MSTEKTVKQGAWSKFMHWYESYQGKKIVGAVYSLGASVVIVGALFKIMHFPGAGVMLTVGMGIDIFNDDRRNRIGRNVCIIYFILVYLLP